MYLMTLVPSPHLTPQGREWQQEAGGISLLSWSHILCPSCQATRLPGGRGAVEEQLPSSQALSSGPMRGHWERERA